jgi:hypothetical protein
MPSSEVDSTATTFTVTGFASAHSLPSEPGKPARSCLRTWTPKNGKIKANTNNTLIMIDKGNNVFCPDSQATNDTTDLFQRGKDGFCTGAFFTPKHGLFGEDTEKAAKAVMGTGDPGQTKLLKIRLLPDPTGISIITPWATKKDEDGVVQDSVVTQYTSFEDARKIPHGVCDLAEFVFERIPASELPKYVYKNKTTVFSKLNSLGDKWVNSDLDKD